MPAVKRKTDPGPGVDRKPVTNRKPRISAAETTRTSKVSTKKKTGSDDSDEEFDVRPKRGGRKVKAVPVEREESDDERQEENDESDEEDEVAERAQAEMRVRDAKGINLPPSSPPRSSPPLSLFVQDALEEVESKRKKDKADHHKFDESKLEVEATYNGAEDELEQLLEDASQGARSDIINDVFTKFDKSLEVELQNHQKYTNNKNDRDIVTFSALQESYVKFLNAHYPLPNLIKNALTTYEKRPITVHELVQGFEKKQKIELEKVHAKIERNLDARDLIRAARKMLRHARQAPPGR